MTFINCIIVALGFGGISQCRRLNHPSAEPRTLRTASTLDLLKPYLQMQFKKYALLIGEAPKVMAIYFCWFVLQNPDTFNVYEAPYLSAVCEALDAIGKVLLADGRQEFSRFTSQLPASRLKI